MTTKPIDSVHGPNETGNSHGRSRCPETCRLTILIPDLMVDETSPPALMINEIAS
ncbi:hypothetical protein SV7mr_51070 [Stieleria bergensis]|uniref:Uncharacterized protein n=1 Tax=Stieleria bergensis TaxID=2528025 RepID=A0A517T2E9_9BACT|nr:hypothetical protein SV7mr_51070 [Planctomycetes bacterium SV_7m_r]